MTTTRVFPADVYDYLKGEVAKHGGVGAGEYSSTRWIFWQVPCCIHGYKRHCEVPWLRDRIETALDSSGVSISANDRAVPSINMWRRRALNARVSWSDYCAELGIVRGEPS